ncbi:MAG: metalloregulator ArsR/SmtB family transcription factor [Vicinamibacterales bacterium]
MSNRHDRVAADMFFALGDRTRLSLVRKLGSGGACSATVLSDGANVSRQAIVKHLQVLEGAGLATREKRGRDVLYSLEPSRLREARLFLDTVSTSWDRAIERLRRFVEEPDQRGSMMKGKVRRREG